jgi:hypothetical protein
MLEVVLLVFILSATFFVTNSYVLWGLFVLAVLVAFPGVMAMFSGGAPCVGTTKGRLESILKLGSFRGSDKVYDLGSGSGRVVRAVADGGVRDVVGFELSLPAYFYSRFCSVLPTVGGKIKFSNFWKKDFSQADALICFLSDKAMLRFHKEIWPSLKYGTKVISNEFKLPNIEADEEERRVYLYVKK